jgi:hypothetical protein
MKQASRIGTVAVSLTLLLSACNGGPRQPAGPAPLPSVTDTLSGTVSEGTTDGLVGVDGVVVSVSGDTRFDIELVRE